MSAISVPFYNAAIFLLASPFLVVTIFVNSLIIALISLVIFCFSLEVYGYSKKRTAFLLSLIFCVSSFVLPYNTTLFPQPLQALLFITSAFFLYKSSGVYSPFSLIDNSYNATKYNPIKKEHQAADRETGDHNRKIIYFARLGGFLLGISVFSHPASIIVIPGFIVYSILSLKRHNGKGLILFLITLAAVLFFVGLVNQVKYGSFTEFGFGSYYDPLKRTWSGLVGLILSPGAGLVFYFPLVILLPLALVRMYKKGRKQLAFFSFLIIYVLSASCLYYGTLDAYDENKTRIWSGAIAWGPRYLLPVLPFIILPFGSLLLSGSGRGRTPLWISFIILCIAGFIVNLPGKLVWSDYGLLYAIDREHLYKINNRVDTMTWNASYSPIVLHMKVLLYDIDYISSIPIEEYRYSTLPYFTYGLAPCEYDLYIFCKFGIAPVLMLSALNVVLVILILKDGINTSLCSLSQLLRYFQPAE